ncbi:MAG: aminopeptidase [Clostridia bacterium]|nr:aminopeptidase [Clostridia bacterium]
MSDSRFERLAYNLVNYSCSLKKGEKILIDASGIDHVLINEIIKQVYALGAFPIVTLVNPLVQRQLLFGINKQHCEILAKYAKYRMEDMDAYIAIRGGQNTFENSDVPPENLQTFMTYYSRPVHHDIRVDKTKWVILRYPNASFAQLAGMSTQAFEDYYFNVCNLDYSKMDRAMDSLKQLMEKTDNVRIVSPDTDLTFSINNISVIKCSGKNNIPDGEVYTAPVKNSVNGRITYNTPSVNGGTKYENISLLFENGKIIDAKANLTEKINKVFDTDEGSRYVGEFALGINPYITSPIGDILFDEKISGSLHFTPGSCYKEASNGNESALHWDLILIQTKEYGGGEIYFDGKLIRKDGLFVLEKLKCLNPENLK